MISNTTGLDFVGLPPIAQQTGRGVVFPWQCDVMGHLATQYYMTSYDAAFFHFLAMLGPVIDDRDGFHVGWADVRHEIDYRSELNAGDLIVLHSAVVGIGRTSLAHRTYMHRLSDKALCSMVDSKTVRFDLIARRAVPIDEAIRASARLLLIDG
jgi:acyl-CoA thioester hydrolase